MSRVQFLLVAVLALALAPSFTNGANPVLCVGPCTNETERAGFDRLGDRVYEKLQTFAGISLLELKQVERALKGLSEQEQLLAAARNLGANELLTFHVIPQNGQIKASAECRRLTGDERRTYTASVTGLADPEAVAGELAAKIAAYLTGSADQIPPTSSEGEGELEPSFADIEDHPLRFRVMRAVQGGIFRGYSQDTFRPNRAITEQEFSIVVERLLTRCPELNKPRFDMSYPKQLVNRVRAITVIMRAVAEESEIDLVEDPKKIVACYKDCDHIPAWALRYVAYALEQGYIDPEPELRPLDPIMRCQVADLISRYLPPNVALGQNGLVIDCRGFKIERSMCPRIESEDGTLIYADPKIARNKERVLRYGIVSYTRDINNAPRAGKNPLRIKAVDIRGSGKDTAIVTNADQDLILQENQKKHFLEDWLVTFLVD